MMLKDGDFCLGQTNERFDFNLIPTLSIQQKPNKDLNPPPPDHPATLGESTRLPPSFHQLCATGSTKA
jgi:hypothetical protein